MFPENRKRFLQQIPPLAPGGVVQRHRQQGLGYGTDVAAHLVRRDQQIGQAYQREAVLERRAKRGRRDSCRGDPRQDPDRDVPEARLTGAQFVQEAGHRQNPGVARAHHAYVLSGEGRFQSGQAALHLALHAVLDHGLSGDAVPDEVDVMAVAGDGVTPPERRVDIRRDVAGSARSEPGHDDFPLSAFGDGKMRQTGQCQRDVSKGGFRGVQCGLGD